MLLHRQSLPSSHAMDGLDASRRTGQKRKAESQDNGRLSKRLSLLNIEKGGAKLYVPVEDPTATAHVASHDSTSDSAQMSDYVDGKMAHDPCRFIPDHDDNDNDNDDMMRLDDTKHKVYIYNLDDELSSSDSEPDDGRLIFLPDIEKHLRTNRIPPRVLPNDAGELAGMQLVLYREPESLTVSGEDDSVRRAVTEARERIRERQREERENVDRRQGQPFGIGWARSPVASEVAERMQAFQDNAAILDDPDAMDLS